MEDISSFGYWVRRRRRVVDLTQQQLANRAGYAVTTIRKIEAGLRRPSREMAERLAECLEVPPEERQAFIEAARAEHRVGNLQPPTAYELAPKLASQPLGPITTVPVGAAIAAPPHNLSSPPTALIGREAEVRSLCEALRQPTVRLVTLTGAPGIGKSRVGLETATRLLPDFADGVFLANLTAVEPPYLLGVLARTLNLWDQDGEPSLTVLQRALRTRQLLLVLDNFEHMAGAGPLVAELLAASSGLKVLVTSREALRISGEHERALPPLPLPQRDPLPPVDELAQNPAVRLFVERAQFVRPSFALNQENGPIIAAICARLDGLPLAIELAAARCKIMDPAALLERLWNPLDILTDGARDLPPHQRTLRNAISWSYHLLSPAEQRLFTSFGVFVGGADLDAVTAICGGGAPDIIDRLTALVDKSLLQTVSGTSGEPRFAMLETIREFAVEQLTRHADIDALREAHAAYYLQVVEAAEGQARGAGRGAATNKLRDDYPNIRAALQFALDTGRSALLVRLSGAMGWFWNTSNFLDEGQRWLSAALAVREPVEPRYHARAFASAALLASDKHEFAVARALFEQAIARYQAAAEHEALAYALCYLGRLLRFQAEHTQAHAALTQALDYFRSLGNERGLAFASYQLARLAYEEAEIARAEQLLQQARAHFSAAGDRWGIALATIHLGRIASARSEYPTARAYFVESLRNFTDLGDVWGIAIAQCKLGWALLHEQPTMGAPYLAASLATFHRIQYDEGIADALTGLGLVALHENDWQRAAQRFGAARAFQSRVASSLLTTDHTDLNRWLAELQQQLGEEQARQALAAGEAAPLREVQALLPKVSALTNASAKLHEQSVPLAPSLG